MRQRRNKQGLVLVTVLWIVVLLTAIAAIVGQASRLDMKVSVSRVDQTRCRWACRAGVESAIAVLNEDYRDSDCLSDPWSDNDQDFNNVALEGCQYTVRVIDEAGKFNINVVTKEQLMALPYMEPEIAGGILDWRDDNDTPSEDGVEGGYYGNLTYPYTIRNGPLRTIRELLLVKDVSEDLFYGEDTNFNGRLDYNERDGDQSPPVDDGDDELDYGWIDQLTCYSYDTDTDGQGQKRININNADERQLERQLQIKASHAKWIVDSKPNRGYQSIGDLVSGNSPQQSGDDGGQQSGDRGSRGGNNNDVQAEPLDLQTFRRIADRITVSDGNPTPGKVNVNTASEEVLFALLGGDDNAQQQALAIISHREGLLYGMQSIADLLDVSGIGVDEFKRIANFVTVRSNVFTIRCVATAVRGGTAGMKLMVEAVVDRSSTPCKVLYWYEGASN